ncbi:MAG TPA: dihydrolipoyl dehydrogenase [Myxococcota bacterium]|nr:dihydrolipoyl dehydrogenase [Myxococcota bacterium]
MAAPERLLVRVPPLGDFEDVEVIEILVAPGDRVTAEQSLITLESDKASMEIPSPAAGTVVELSVSEGARVSEGAPILVLEVSPAAARGAQAVAAQRSAEPAAAPRDAAPPAAERARPAEEAPAERRAPSPERPAGARPAPRPVAPSAGERLRADVLVLGAGPGGYTAAFRAADLGRGVVLVEREPVLGGVCLHVGCIPSKALLHVAAVVRETEELAGAGVAFGAPRIELPRLRAHKQAVVKRLADGLVTLARQRKVHVVQGAARFESANRVRVEAPGGATTVDFDHAIVAVGSRPIALPGIPDDPRIWTSTDALDLEAVPERLLVVGGGVIGLELATVFAALGSRVSIVELLPELLTGVDADLVRPVRAALEARCEAIWRGTRLLELRAERDGLRARFEGQGAPAEAAFDRALIAVGRTGRADEIAAERAGLRVERGYLTVDAKQRTSQPHIFAIGDVSGPPLLAHRAMHQGKVAAEVIAGLPAEFDAAAVPNVAYTDPEVAWAGLLEAEAREKGIAYEKAVFPWSASGRALGLRRPDGHTKLLFEPGGGRLLGAGIVGAHAGDLIVETVLALELGADATDIALTIHPHPTLSETIGLAAEVGAGTATDLLPPRRRSQ